MKFDYYYKIVENGYIVQIQGGSVLPKRAIPLEDEAAYNALLKYINEEKPADTLEAVYRLSSEIEKYIACERTHDETVDWYVQEIVAGNITIEDVPEEYKEEVTAKLPTPEVDRYQEGYDRAVLDCLESGIL